MFSNRHGSEPKKLRRDFQEHGALKKQRKAIPGTRYMSQGRPNQFHFEIHYICSQFKNPVMSNRKRTPGRKIQSIKYYKYEMKYGVRIRIEIPGPAKQVKHTW